MMRISVENEKKVQNQLADIRKRLKESTEGSLEQSVYELERNIVRGAPVDTGRYKLGWRVVKIDRYTYEIRNAVEYAKYLIFGTSTRGVLHDVRGVVRYWKHHILRRAVETTIKKR